MNITADGVLMSYGKVFNQQYPGPWIRKSTGLSRGLTVR